MTRDNDGLQGLSTRTGILGRRGNTVKRMSLSVDDWSLVDGKIETNMIINRINHYHIIHHQGILYNILNLVNFFTKRNCTIPSITTMYLKMFMKMERCSMEDEGGLLILILIRETNFWTLIGEIGFLILFVTTEEDTQILMSLGFLLLMKILILYHLCFGLMKLISYLTWSIFSWRVMSSSWLTNLKKEQ